MFTENLADKCNIIIARIVDSKDSSKTLRGRRSSTAPKDLIKSYGLDTEQLNYKGKMCKYCMEWLDNIVYMGVFVDINIGD